MSGVFGRLGLPSSGRPLLGRSPQQPAHLHRQDPQQREVHRTEGFVGLAIGRAQHSDRPVHTRDRRHHQGGRVVAREAFVGVEIVDDDRFATGHRKPRDSLARHHRIHCIELHRVADRTGRAQRFARFIHHQQRRLRSTEHDRDRFGDVGSQFTDEVGRVTSLAESPGYGSPVALAYLSRAGIGHFDLRQ